MSRLLVATALLLLGPPALAADVVPPPMDKKTRTVTVSAELPFSADTVWAAVAEDYGRIADSHPRIVRSDYRHGSLQGELGAERSCWFDDKGKKVLHEQIVGWEPETMTMQNRVLEAAGFPMDPDNALGTYHVESLGPDRSRFVITLEMRMKPAVLTGPMSGAFEGLMEDYMVALEHHLATGEKVDRESFAAIAAARR